MRQTAFPLPSSPQDAQNDFIVSSCNRLAYQHIQDWPDNFGVLPYPKTLIIRGARSSGKSFLANLWAKKTGALFIRKNHQLSDSILAHHQAFVLEDFSYQWKQEDVLHYFNILHENNKYLLITLSHIPDIRLADLASRLNSANRIDILMPDDELIKILVFKQFSDFSILLDEESLNYLVKVLPREFSKITPAIRYINQASLEQKRKISIPFIKTVLASHVNEEWWDREDSNLRPSD